MTATPLADIEAEAIRLVDGLRDRDVTARLLGGLAIAQHRHVELPATLARAYGDIDIVVPPGSASRFREAMEGLGYTANKRFNNMRATAGCCSTTNRTVGSWTSSSAVSSCAMTSTCATGSTNIRARSRRRTCC